MADERMEEQGVKILVVSDTHGRFYNLETVLEREQPIAMVLHMGDLLTDREELEMRCGCDCRVVAGNCDAFSRLPDELTIPIGKHVIHMEHGYWPPVREDRIEARAKQFGADIMMFGHTHRPELRQKGDVLIVNPGSLSAPRQADGRPSYIIMTVDSEGEAEFELKYL